MAASAARTRQLPLEGGSIIGFKDRQGGVKQFAFWHYDDVVPRPYLISTKNLSDQSFSSISLDGITEFSCGCDSEPGGTPRAANQHERRAESSVSTDAPCVDLLKFSTPVHPLRGTQTRRRVHTIYSELTVRRFRPLARRRFSTRRPFFVLIRTRNPCVRTRRRRFGWNVLLPFMLTPVAQRLTNEPTMLANASEECQSRCGCVRVRPSLL
jgi:hypothetical protein